MMIPRPRRKKLDFKGLAKAIPAEYNDQYHDLLVEWVNMDLPPRKFICRVIPCFLWIYAPHILTHAAKLGFFENISVYLRIIAATQVQSEERASKLDEFNENMIESYQNMLVNYGVIGALIFSIVFGLAVADFDINDSSIELFGRDGACIIKHFYFALIFFCVLLSLCIIYQSMLQYKQLVFWMPDQAAKMRWIHTFSLVQIVLLGEIIQSVIIITIPVGAAVAISPVAGLLGLVTMLLFGCFVLVSSIKADLTVRILWEEARRIMQGETPVTHEAHSELDIDCSNHC